MATDEQVAAFLAFLAASRVKIAPGTYPFQRGWDEAMDAAERKARELLLGTPPKPPPIRCKHGNALTDVDGQVVDASCGCHHADVLGNEG